MTLLLDMILLVKYVGRSFAGSEKLSNLIKENLFIVIEYLIKKQSNYNGKSALISELERPDEDQMRARQF